MNGCESVVRGKRKGRRLLYSKRNPFEDVGTWRSIFEPSTVTSETERKRGDVGIQEPPPLTLPPDDAFSAGKLTQHLNFLLIRRHFLIRVFRGGYVGRFQNLWEIGRAHV